MAAYAARHTKSSLALLVGCAVTTVRRRTFSTYVRTVERKSHTSAPMTTGVILYRSLWYTYCMYRDVRTEYVPVFAAYSSLRCSITDTCFCHIRCHIGSLRTYMSIYARFVRTVQLPLVARTAQTQQESQTATEGTHDHRLKSSSSVLQITLPRQPPFQMSSTVPAKFFVTHPWSSRISSCVTHAWSTHHTDHSTGPS